MDNKEFVIYGAGGHARSVADVILSNSPDAHITFVDESAKPDERIYGFEVVREKSQDDGKDYFVAIGDNERRKAQSSALGNLVTAEVIANDAHIGKEAVIGKGTFVGHEAYVGPLTQIGENCIINTRAILEHEVVVGSNSSIAPGAIIGGRVTIGENVFIGLGARVIDNVSICSDVVIGAASTVVDSITEPGTYVGTPARKT